MRTAIAAADPDPVPDVIWSVSTFCESNACVEVAFVPGHVVMRDGTGATLTYTTSEWAAFTAGVKRGQFDV